MNYFIILLIINLSFWSKNFQAEASEKSGYVIEYSWPKDPAALYYIGSYIARGKYHRFRSENPQIIVREKAKFKRLVGINNLNQISREYSVFSIEAKLLKDYKNSNLIKEKSNEAPTGTAKKASSVIDTSTLLQNRKKTKIETEPEREPELQTMLGYIKESENEEELVSKKLDQKSSKQINIKKSSIHLALAYASPSIEAKTETTSYSTSNSMVSVPLGASIDLNKGDHFFLGMRTEYEFSGFDIQDIYEEKTTLNFSDFLFGFYHKIGPVFLGYDFGWLKTPKLTGIEVDILDNSLAKFTDQKTNYLAINTEMSFKMGSNILNTKLAIKPYFTDASGLGYKIAISYERTIFANLVNVLASFRYDSYALEFDNNCPSSQNCGATSEMNISTPSLLLGLKAVTEKQFF